VDEEITDIESKTNFEEPEFAKQSLILHKETESCPSPRQNKVLSNNEIILANDDNESDIANKNLDLDEKLEKMIEKSQGLWKCKGCNKTSNQKHHITYHAETHMQGIKHSCHICMKTYPTRNGLQSHVSDVHSKLYSCKICGKTDMNRTTLRKTHKRNCNGTPREQ